MWGVRGGAPRAWHDKAQSVAGAAYKGGSGTALCVLQAREGFVVTLLAQDGFWKTHQEAMLPPKPQNPEIYSLKFKFK